MNGRTKLHPPVGPEPILQCIPAPATAIDVGVRQFLAAGRAMKLVLGRKPGIHVLVFLAAAVFAAARGSLRILVVTGGNAKLAVPPRHGYDSTNVPLYASRRIAQRIGGGNLEFFRLRRAVWIPLHKRHIVFYLILEGLTNLCIVGFLLFLDSDEELLIIGEHKIRMIHALLNSLSPLKTFVAIALVIASELCQPVAIVRFYPYPTGFLLSTYRDEEEVEISLPEGLHLTVVPNAINYDRGGADSRLISTGNDLVYPIPTPRPKGLFSPKITMILFLASPAKLPLYLQSILLI